MVTEGDLPSGGEHTIQYTDDVLQNCTLGNHIISLTNATQLHSKIFFKKKTLCQNLANAFDMYHYIMFCISNLICYDVLATLLIVISTFLNSICLVLIIP